MSFITNISSAGPSDQELVLLYRQNQDLNTLSTLYQRYMELVYGVCLKYLKDPEASKDAVMQIFEELIQKLPKHDVTNFRSWLHVVSRNYCLMQLRTPKNIKTVELKDGDVQLDEKLHHNGIMEKEEAFRLMEECMEKLSADQQQSVRLFYLEEKCYKEISGITGLEWNKVRSLIQNGKRNLKICMEKNKS